MQVHLVDGTLELFRCFHGAPRARTASGSEVGAARGLFATLVALLNQPEVTHVAVAFDAVVAPLGVDRRKPEEAVLASQIELAADVARALAVEVWPSGRFQADELLATAAARFGAHPLVDRVVICTTDLDLAQSIRGDRVVLLDRSRKRVTTEDDIVARFGVPPRVLADLFALVGDRSDGVAGVAGWGLQSAAALLRAYDVIERIPDDHTTWSVPVRGAARLAAALRERRREAIISRDVLKVRDDVRLSVELDDVEWHGADRQRTAALAERLEYDAPVSWLTRWRD